MAQKIKDTFNNTHINKNMMLSIVTLATKEIAGVVDIAQPPFQKIQKVFSKNIGDGVNIKFTQLGLIIDVYIVVEIGYSANDVVYRVQQNIKNSISTMIELPIKAINVHILDAEKHRQA
ncbi:MAG: Asp23/Gls24 family envelope stress response protein [Clostridia bacterium]|nr:Asp23/Gls24 family envelope stress response protein [Clostridia bacterium]